MLRHGVVALTIAVTMLSARTVLAERSARLVYIRDATAMSCPDEAPLRRAVRERFGYDPLLPSAKQQIIVRVRKERVRFAASVELVDDAGVVRGVRDLESDAGCEALMDVIALSIAIALDAAEKTAPQASPAQASAREDDSWKATSPHPTDDADGEIRPAGSIPALATVVGPDEPPALSEKVSAPMRLQPELGFDGLVSVGTAPGPSGGVELSFGLRQDFVSIEVRDGGSSMRVRWMLTLAGVLGFAACNGEVLNLGASLGDARSGDASPVDPSRVDEGTMPWPAGVPGSGGATVMHLAQVDVYDSCTKISPEW